MSSNSLITQWLNNRSLFKRKIHFKHKKNLEKNINVSDITKQHKLIFSELNCLDCANCCKSLPAKLTPKDIERVAKRLKMDLLSFTQQYVIADDDGDLVLGPPPCPFLAHDNMCQVYESRPLSCKTYPHTEQAKQAKHIGLHLENAYYCPAVYHIITELTNKTT